MGRLCQKAFPDIDFPPLAASCSERTIRPDSKAEKDLSLPSQKRLIRYGCEVMQCAKKRSGFALGSHH